MVLRAVLKPWWNVQSFSVSVAGPLQPYDSANYHMAGFDEGTL